MPPSTGSRRRKKKTTVKKKNTKKRKPSLLTFNFTGNPSWTCPLTCTTCTFKKSDGKTCKNRVCFGTPLCWSHNKKVYGVQIKESGEKNAGKGLFTTEPRSPGDWVCPYLGVKTTKHCIDKWYRGNNTTAPYVECDDSRSGIRNVNIKCVDAACTRGIGSMANTKVIFVKDEATGTAVPEIAEQKFQNCISEVRTPSQGGDGTIWLRTLVGVAKNNELFLDYGPTYILQDNHSTKRRVQNDNFTGPPHCAPPVATRRSTRVRR